MKKIGFCLKSNIQGQGKDISLVQLVSIKSTKRKKEEAGDFCTVWVTKA